MNAQVRQVRNLLFTNKGLPISVGLGPIDTAAGITVQITSKCGCTERLQYYPPPLGCFVIDTNVPCENHNGIKIEPMNL